MITSLNELSLLWKHAIPFWHRVLHEGIDETSALTASVYLQEPLTSPLVLLLENKKKHCKPNTMVPRKDPDGNYYADVADGWLNQLDELEAALLEDNFELFDSILDSFEM